MKFDDIFSEYYMDNDVSSGYWVSWPETDEFINRLREDFLKLAETEEQKEKVRKYFEVDNG